MLDNSDYYVRVQQSIRVANTRSIFSQFCSRISVDMLPYISTSTLIRLDYRKQSGRAAAAFGFLPKLGEEREMKIYYYTMSLFSNETQQQHWEKEPAPIFLPIRSY